MLKRKARIGKSTIKKLIECFSADVSATQAGKLSKVNRNTANLWYNNFREKILEYQEHENGSFHGEVELNMLATEGKGVVEQKTKYRCLVLRREKMVESIPKSSKMPQNTSFYQSLRDWSLRTTPPFTQINGRAMMV